MCRPLFFAHPLVNRHIACKERKVKPVKKMYFAFNPVMYIASFLTGSIVNIRLIAFNPMPVKEKERLSRWKHCFYYICLASGLQVYSL